MLPTEGVLDLALLCVLYAPDISLQRAWLLLASLANLKVKKIIEICAIVDDSWSHCLKVALCSLVLIRCSCSHSTQFLAEFCLVLYFQELSLVGVCRFVRCSGGLRSAPRFSHNRGLSIL